MPYNELILERRGHVAVVTLNRPERLNALSQGLRDDLMAAVEELRDDDDIWAVVFTGAGRGFCSGADIQGGGATAPELPDGAGGQWHASGAGRELGGTPLRTRT